MKAEELALSKMDPRKQKEACRLAKMKALMFYHERSRAAKENQI